MVFHRIEKYPAAVLVFGLGCRELCLRNPVGVIVEENHVVERLCLDLEFPGKNHAVAAAVQRHVFNRAFLQFFLPFVKQASSIEDEVI